MTTPKRGGSTIPSRLSFDQWQLNECLEHEVLAALPGFALPGGDAVHAKIMIDRFTAAHDRLVRFEHDGFRLAAGYADPDVLQLGAFMDWLNHVSKIGAEQALDRFGCTDCGQAHAASRRWLGNIRDNWLGQGRIASIITQEDVGPKVLAEPGYYWVRLLTPAALIYASRMSGCFRLPVLAPAFPHPMTQLQGDRR